MERARQASRPGAQRPPQPARGGSEARASRPCASPAARALTLAALLLQLGGQLAQAPLLRGQVAAQGVGLRPHRLHGRPQLALVAVVPVHLEGAVGAGQGGGRGRRVGIWRAVTHAEGRRARAGQVEAEPCTCCARAPGARPSRLPLGARLRARSPSRRRRPPSVSWSPPRWQPGSSRRWRPGPEGSSGCPAPPGRAAPARRRAPPRRPRRPASWRPPARSSPSPLRSGWPSGRCGPWTARPGGRRSGVGVERAGWGRRGRARGWAAGQGGRTQQARRRMLTCQL